MEDDTSRLLKSEDPKDEQEEIKAEPSKKQKRQIIMMNEVKCGKYKSVFRLIKANILPSNVILDVHGKWRLIHYLVLNNKLRELIILLTEFKADINAVDGYQQTALHMAALYTLPNMLKYLTDQPLINIDCRDCYKATPLINTVNAKFVLGFVYLCFEKGSDASIVDVNGFNVFHWAAYKGLLPILQVAQHIPSLNLHATDNQGMTAVFKAVSGISYNAVKYFVHLERTNLEVRNAKGQTLCEYAESISTHPKVLSYIQKHTELQKIQKTGIITYTKNKPLLKTIPYIYKHIVTKHGRALSLIFNFLIAFFMILTSTQITRPVFSKLEFMKKLIAILYVLSLICWLTLFLCLLLIRDPGYEPIKTLSHPNNVIGMILDQIKEGNWTDNGDYCLSCLIRKSPTTNHCLACKCCVSGFHFHLSKLNICIGRRNFPIYFFYIFFTIITWYTYSYTILNSILVIPNAYFPVSLLEQFCELVISHCGISLLLVCLLIFSVNLLYDMLFMCAAICKGLTVYQIRFPYLNKHLFELVKDENLKEPVYVLKERSWSLTNIKNFFMSIKELLRIREQEYMKLNDTYDETIIESIN